MTIGLRLVGTASSFVVVSSWSECAAAGRTVIVVLVSLVFMEWRSALLVAISIPVTVAFTLGLSQLVGIDLQQVSIAALIIALGLLVIFKGVR